MDDILNESRRLCVEALRKAAAEGALIEPALRGADGGVVYDSEGLCTPIRKDVATNDGASWTTANFNAPMIRPSTPVRATRRDQLKVSLESSTWDYIKFGLSPLKSTVDWEAISTWFLKWFDPEDLKGRSEENVYEVVHFVSDPEEVDSNFRLFVDFGSAPIEAFYELLDCFAALGFNDCRIQ